MRYLTLTFLVLMMTAFYSCSEDDCCDNGQTIHYDGQNANAPELPAGVYEFAVRYPERLLASVEDRSLSAVEMYMYDIPRGYTLRIYEDVGGDLGQVLYSADIITRRSNAWNVINLDTPLDVQGIGIWVGIEVDCDRDMQTIGCDSGPADANGDWLYDEVDKQYIKYVDRVGTSVNWNIRAVFL